MTMTGAPDLHVLSDDDAAVTFDELREAGYLLLAVPVELGGLGGDLVQVCDQQRRLARRAPALALALTGHLAWCGAAADRRREGDSSLSWVLDRALAGEVISSAGRRCDPVQEAWSQSLSVAVGLGAFEGGREGELPDAYDGLVASAGGMRHVRRSEPS
jgi:hypothetical protein